MGGGLISDFCQRRLTLAGRLEAEGLEAASEGGGVNDVHAVLALAPPVERDGDHEQHHRHHAGRQAGVQRHVAAALHTLAGGDSDTECEKNNIFFLFLLGKKKERKTFPLSGCTCLIRTLGYFFPAKNKVQKKRQKQNRSS